MFEEVLQKFQDGADPVGGYQTSCGQAGPRKARRIVWCLSEADKQRRRGTIRKAICMQISRDERHGILHTRYRCVDSDFNFHCGFLGQSIGHTSYALGLTNTLYEIIHEFCLEDACPPAHCRSRPQLDEELHKHIINITEAISVDSASNELASARELCS